MQQGGRDFTTHALPQRKLAHGPVQKTPDTKALDKKITPRQIYLAIKTINLCKQIKTVARRQMVPKLGTLAKHSADLVRQRFTVFSRRITRNFSHARSRVQNPRQHFYGCRFSCAIWPDKGNALSFFELERNTGNSHI